MSRTVFVTPTDGITAVASHIAQVLLPINLLEDFRDGAAPAGGNLNAGSFKIVNVAVPTAATDAATKNYVDAHPQLPTTGEKAALAGSKDPPGANNLFVTQADWSVHRDIVRFRDDFLGARSPSWTLAGAGGTYTQQAALGGVGLLATGATLNNNAILSFAGAHCVDTAAEPVLYILAALGQTANCIAQIGLYRDADNLIEFRFDSSVAATWKVRCRAGGVETLVDTGVLANTAPHSFEVVALGTEVNFRLDGGGTLVGANLPTGYLEPRIRIETLAASNATLAVDLVDLRARRD